MTENIGTIEKEAYQLLEENRYQEAAELFCKVASRHSDSGRHETSAICFASAASSLAIESGEKSFFRAASIYKKAALEAASAGDLEYSGILYKHAAVCFERDLEYLGFSECFFESKECQRKYLALTLFHPDKIRQIKNNSSAHLKGFSHRIRVWLVLTISSVVWGHGEKPERTVGFGAFSIFLCAFFYSQGYLMKDGLVFNPQFFEALYFSVITFTTVGYGDNVPVGFSKVVVILESFGGLFIVPIFIAGLCRKYLRF